jgi:hypothetical protein
MAGTKKKASRVSAAKRYAQIERISIAGTTERMAPLGLHTYAESFLTAARSLPPPTAPFDPVRPYLVCHSIELGLKAFLSLQGSTMLELAEGTYGHNLENIFQKAIEKGLGTSVRLTAAHESAIRVAAVYYSGKVLEYPAVGEAMLAYPSMPPVDTLFEVAANLVESLRQPCREAR